MMKSIKLLIILWVNLSFAQTSNVSGTINVVEEDGFYRIHIPQSVRSFAKPDLRDLRIWDDQNNQVPYFLQPNREYEKLSISEFSEFSMVSNTRIADTSSTYIFRNPFNTMDSAVLLFANYQGSKSYRLQGSNDGKTWFGVVNKGQLHQLNDPKETSVYKTIQFPLARYSSLKIVFNDVESLPVNLIKIGSGAQQIITVLPKTMVEVPVKTKTYSEVDKNTQIKITFEKPEVISQLRLSINAPEFYNRNAQLYTLKKREVKRNLETYRVPIATFAIRSDRDLVFDFPQTLEEELYLEIENKDNPKLEIKAFHMMQTPVILVARLKANAKYTVTAGDQNLDFPDYDISEVSHANVRPISDVQIGNIIYPVSEKNASETRSFWQQSWFMWSCIGVAALMIVYFALNLLKDVNKTNM